MTGFNLELLRERREKTGTRWGLGVGDVVTIVENTGYGFGRINIGIIVEWNINGYWKVNLLNGENVYIAKSKVGWCVYSSPHDGYGNACKVVKICQLDQLDLR